ncbi:MAG TPA: hypothetical protein VK179_10745 [Bacteroidales bacterium]|nr:hypothetical protein [Bacteroidales bacterium]
MFLSEFLSTNMGWDCPFAYILASLADKSSAVDVEQILGRVLRQPYVIKHSALLLNVSYVLTASAKFNETLQNIVLGLQSSGFSEKDYRQKDNMPSEEKKKTTVNQLDAFLFPEQHESNIAKIDEDEIITERISFNSEPSDDEKVNIAVNEIQNIAENEISIVEHNIEKLSQQPIDENIFQEMGEKVRRYSMNDANKELASKIKLPQFFMDIPRNDLYGLDKALLNQESLLKGFKLSTEDSKISFENITSDLYKVDVELIKKDEYAPRFTKIEDAVIKDPMIEYILSKPKDGQVKDITHQIVQLIGDMYPIPDQEIRMYIERVLCQLNIEQLHDVLLRKWSYSDRIRAKIKQHADTYAESIFNDMIKIRKIYAEPFWHFSEEIVPGVLGASIGNSLYEREGAMNNFETTVITDIASLSNVAFWHRNLGRGKGFSINGFKSNHYPDFIVVTKSGNIILIETKGDDRDNTDSLAKCRLGNRWAELSGKGFFYFMIFEQKSVEGSVNISKAKELIKQL